MKKTFLILAMIVSAMLLSCNPKNEDDNNNSGTGGNNAVNGHEYVDLGLPSGLLWATCNIGADRPEDVGDYFAWGETSPKDEYTKENSLTYGKSIGDISGDPQYDAARANWGDMWRMPTIDEVDELVDNCNFQYISKDGVLGAKITGPNGNKIFLPITGVLCDASKIYDEDDGYYWSSTPGYYDCYTHGYETPCHCTSGAYQLSFDEDCIFVGSYGKDYNGRGGGCPIRPVIFVW